MKTKRFVCTASVVVFLLALQLLSDFNFGLSNNAMAKGAIGWSTIREIGSSLLSSIISISSSSGTELLKSEVKVGEQECGTKVYNCYKEIYEFNQYGEYIPKKVKTGQLVIRCGRYPSNPPEYDEKYLDTEASSVIKEPHFIECNGWTLGYCKARTLSCEELGHKCD